MGHYELRGDRKIWVEDVPAGPKTKVAPAGSKTKVVPTDTKAKATPASPKTTPSYTPRQSFSYEYGFSHNIVTKVFSILLPVLAFIVGQAIQYILYFVLNRVLLLELVFEHVNIYVVGASSLSALISTILICYGTWHFADDDDICAAWTYIIVSTILLSTVPIITGFIGLVASIIITCMLDEYECEYLPVVPAISSFILGQIIMWFTYAGTGRIVLLDELLTLMGWNVSHIGIAIFSTICGVASTIIMSYVGYHFMDNIEKEKAFGTMIPFCLLMIFTPAVSCFVALVYSFIVFCCRNL